jgi:membrane-associated protein
VSDVVNFRLGGVFGVRALRKVECRSSARGVVGWMRSQLVVRGEPVLVAARFVPGGGLAGAVLAGGLCWPLRRFLPVSVAGSVLWTTYAVLLGYLGGRLVGQPLLAVLLSLAVAGAVSVLVGRVMGRVLHRSADREPIEAASAEQGSRCTWVE